MSTPIDPDHVSPAGRLPRPFYWFAGCSLFTAALYADSLRPLLTHWLQFDQSMGHALPLAVLLCGWMASLRVRFDAAARHPSRRGLVLLGLCSVGWFLAALGDIDLLEQLALLAMVFCTAVLVAGWRSAMVLAPPLAMFVFCVPVWDELNDQLVDLSASVVGTFFEYSPVVAHVAGNAIQLPEGTVVIAGGCSGLRYVIVGLALANLASAVNRLSFASQVRANLLALALMLAVNWVRIIVIVFVAYFSQMRASLVRDHDTFGWIVFLIAVVPLLLYVRNAPSRAELPS